MHNLAPAVARAVERALDGSREDVSDPTIPWEALPGPQEMALESAADITGYGGAAGGGKTDWLLGTALTQHRKSIVFRREFVQLRDVIFRAQDILSDAEDPGRFNGQQLLWRFGDGRTLELGACQHPDSWRKYRGRPHDFIGFDEASEFLEGQVRALMGWLRTTIEYQRCRAGLAFNPPTSSEGMWIIGFFGPWLDRKHPNPALPGELRYYAMVDGVEVEREDGEPFEHDGETVIPLSRTFIPARLADNPYLKETGYGSTLQSLPEPLRSQLLYGDFDAGIGVDPWQVIPTAWAEQAMARWKASQQPSTPMTMAGMDVAHGGKDKTVLARRFDAWVAKLHVWAGAETPDGKSAAMRVAPLVDPKVPINVDAIGYGAAAAERLADKPEDGGYGMKAVPINVADSSNHRDRSGRFKMVNKRAEMFWRLREALDPEIEGDRLALPPDPELLADLTSARYEIAPGGIRIEKKEEIIARLGRSPDKAEAVALSVLEPRSMVVY
jgi:hypothetical protein